MAAVPDGATLIVRPGNYAPFVVSGKGLSILGENANVAGSFVVPRFENTAPGQVTVVRGLHITLDGFLAVWNCSGPVVLEDITFTSNSGSSRLFVRNSSQVLMRGLQSSGSPWLTIDLDNSDSVLESCAANGPWSQRFANPSPAVSVLCGSAQFVDCTLGGGIATGVGTHQPAIGASGADLRILSPCTLSAQVPEISGSGTVRIDPAISPAPAILGLSVQSAPMPAVQATSAPLTGTLTATATGPTGAPTILLLGLPGPPVIVPGVSGAFSLDPAVHWFAAFGVAPLSSSVAVPNQPGLRGIRLGWQSAAQIGGAIEASNPSWSLVR